jgi:nitroimidazol reductase NimA-like FMN-containing flavoprotein (pyridoxamine 5'-phosphate oxidase superfamily)
VVFGRAAAAQPGLEEKRRILDAMIARYFPGRVPGRDYESASDAQLEATALVAVEIREWSAKLREGGPNGEADADPARAGSAGVIPLGRG